MEIEIITPEAVVLRETAEMAVLPAYEGEMGVLDGHIPMIVSLKKGQIRVRSTGEEKTFEVDGGYAEVTGDKIVVLSESVKSPLLR